VTKDELQLLTGYMKLRNQRQFTDASPYVFITSSGSKMTQSNVANSLTAAFQQSSFSDRITCTKLRKTAVTEIHKAFPEKRHDMAAHMCHRLATAKKHYRFNEKVNNTVKWSQLLRSTFHGADHQTNNNSNEIDNAPAMVNQETATSGIQETCEVQPYQKRILWNTDDRDIVRKKFASFIQKQKVPFAEISSMLTRDVELVHRLECNLKLSGRALALAVRDKIRSFYRGKYGYKPH
jgi:hypothetical protein